MRCYFVFFEGWPGVDTALRCFESSVKELYPTAETSFLPLLNNGRMNINSLRKIQTEPPDFLFLGGWDNNVKTFLLNANNLKSVTTILLWCSPITQMELGGELSRFSDVWSLLNENQIDKLAILLDTDAEVLSEYNSNVVYMPVSLRTEDLDTIKGCIFPEMEGKINVDLFCAPCARKNIAIQLMALASLKNENLMVHANYNLNSITNPYFNIIKQFYSNNFANHSWMGRSSYLGIIKNMDFASQVTLSESFNYTAAEHMYYKVPVILSRSSPIARNLENKLKDLIVDKADDIYSIKSIAQKLSDNTSFRKEMGEISKQCILELNNKNKDILKCSLSRIFKGDLQ